MRQYRCRHAVEAARWFDTDANRELFADWFDEHDTMFETRGPAVMLPEGGEAVEGEWILFSSGEFIAMEDEMFRSEYTETP